VKRKTRTQAEVMHESINRVWDRDDEVLVKTFSETLSIDAALKALRPKYMQSMPASWAQNIIDAYMHKGCNPRTGSKELSKYVRTIVKKLSERNLDAAQEAV
jgi:hypothetical protein